MDFTLYVYDEKGECIYQELIIRPTEAEAKEEAEGFVNNQYPGNDWEIHPNAYH